MFTEENTSGFTALMLEVMNRDAKRLVNFGWDLVSLNTLYVLETEVQGEII